MINDNVIWRRSDSPLRHMICVILVKCPCLAIDPCDHNLVRLLIIIRFTRVLFGRLVGWSDQEGRCCLSVIGLNVVSELVLSPAILADDNSKCIFLNETDRIPIRISLKFVPRSPIDNKPVLLQVMAWRRTGDRPLPELMLTQFTDAYMWY